MLLSLVRPNGTAEANMNALIVLVTYRKLIDDSLVFIELGKPLLQNMQISTTIATAEKKVQVTTTYKQDSTK